jgi:tetratricopeptide (TPR) repeat protein
LVALNNLAMLYDEEGRLAEAVPIGEEILAGRRALLGPTHPLTIMSMNNLAYMYKNQSRFDEARQLLAEAIATGERVLGEKHPETAIYVHSLAEVEISAGNRAEAERLLQRAIAAYRLQRSYQFLPVALYQLAQVVASAGREEAAGYLREAIAAGYQPPVPPSEDPAFAPIKTTPAFQRAISQIRAQR